MGKNLEPQFAFRCDKKTIQKLEYIAEENTRTRNQEMKHIIKKYINEYEAEHGEIQIEEKTTRAEAVEEFKEALGKRERKETGIKETMKKSFQTGMKFGKAEK